MQASVFNPTLGRHVQIEKLEQLPERPVGEGSGGPITPGYYLKGHLLYEPVIGKALNAWRYERCGVKAEGEFLSSNITKITRVDDKTLLVQTSNSIYKITSI